MEVRQGFRVSINESYLSKWCLEANCLTLSNQSPIFNSTLHPSYSAFYSFIEKRFVGLGNLKEMDRWLIKLIAIFKTVSKVLIHVLGQEWCDASHEG